MNINFCLTNKQGAKIVKASESANKKRQDISTLPQPIIMIVCGLFSESEFKPNLDKEIAEVCNLA